MSRILIVDDEPSYGDSLRQLLSDEGHMCDAVQNGTDALAFAARHCPDIAIIDWGLAGGSTGGDVARRLRAACPLLRVILMTGYDASDVSRADLDATRAVILEKPFGINAVLAAIGTPPLPA